MNRRIFLGQVLMAVLVLWCCAAPSEAVTHMGVAPGKHVSLYLYQNKLYRVGLLAVRSEFTAVPVGNALVITDINWCIYGTANHFFDLDVNILSGSRMELLFRAAVKTDAAGDAIFQQNFTSGLVFGPGAKIFPIAWGATTLRCYLQGYLVPYP